MKKKFYMLLTALLALTFFAAASAATLETLQQQAVAYLPADAVYLSLDNDDGQDELKYWSESYQAMYEVYFDADSGELNKIKGESWRDYGSKNVVLTEAQVLLKLAEMSPDALVDFVVLDQDDGLYEYKLAFHTETYYGVLKLNPETGAILEYEHDYASVRTGNAAGISLTAGSGDVTPDEAKELVLARLEGGSLLYIQEDWDDGRLVYEGEAADSSYEYDFEIDAATGRFLEWERDQFREMAMVVAQLSESSKSTSSSNKSSSSSSSSKSSSSSSKSSSSSSSGSSGLIGTSRAKEIALDRAGGGRVVSIKLDWEDGRQVYEGEVHDSKYEYEFEIDAKTGKIRDWDKERHDD